MFENWERELKEVVYSIVTSKDEVSLKMLFNTVRFVEMKPKNRLWSILATWRPFISLLRSIYGDKMRLQYFEEWIEK